MFMELKNIFFHFPKQTLLLSGGVETLLCGVPAVLNGISRKSDLVHSGHIRPLGRERQARACGLGDVARRPWAELPPPVSCCREAGREWREQADWVESVPYEAMQDGGVGSDRHDGRVVGGSLRDKVTLLLNLGVQKEPAGRV